MKGSGARLQRRHRNGGHDTHTHTHTHLVKGIRGRNRGSAPSVRARVRGHDTYTHTHTHTHTAIRGNTSCPSVGVVQAAIAVRSAALKSPPAGLLGRGHQKWRPFADKHPLCPHHETQGLNPESSALSTIRRYQGTVVQRCQACRFFLRPCTNHGGGGASPHFCTRPSPQ